MSSKKTPPPIQSLGLDDLCHGQVLVESIPFISSLFPRWQDTLLLTCLSAFGATLLLVTLSEIYTLISPGALYSSFLDSTAHAIRAILFATATSTLCRGRLLNKAWIQRLKPSVLFSTQMTTARAPSINSFLSIRLPRLLMPPMRVLSPLAYCFGVKPNQADMLRPFLNCLAFPGTPSRFPQSIPRYFKH